MRYFIQISHLQPGAKSRHWFHPLFTAHSSVRHVWGVFPVPGPGVQTGAWQAGQLPSRRVPWVLGSFQEGFSARLGAGGCPGKGLKGAGGVFTGWGWKGGRDLGEEDQPVPSRERARRAWGGFRGWQSRSRCWGAGRGGAHLGGAPAGRWPAWAFLERCALGLGGARRSPAGNVGPGACSQRWLVWVRVAPFPRPVWFLSSLSQVLMNIRLATNTTPRT